MSARVCVAVRVMCVWCGVFSLSLVIDAAAHPPSLLQNTENAVSYTHLRPLLEAIIRQENGRLIYSAAQLDEMLRRGGVLKPGVAEVPLPPVKPPVKSAGLAAASTGVGLATIASDPALRDAVQASGIPWLILTVSFLGIAATGYLLWHALRKRKPEVAT